MINFFVHGKPMSTQTGSIIHPGGGKRAMPLRRNPEWSKTCKTTAIKDRNEKGWRMLSGAVSMGVTVFVPRPQKPRSHYPTQGADVLNILKGPMDAWEGIVYKNDNQVIRFHRLEKRWTTEAYPSPGLLVDFFTWTA